MVDCCSAPGLLPFNQALNNMLDMIHAIKDVEQISLNEALGRTLAADVSSPVNVPPNDNSAMDGYAFDIQSLAESNTLKLVGRSMAGAPFQGQCKIGECVRIMTGAKVPTDCNTVEMQENCQAVDNNIQFLSSRNIGDNVRNKGEDIAVEQNVFVAGRELQTADIGVLASLGIDKVSVYRRIKVALISTGDELKKPKEALEEGDIYESNSHFLNGILSKLNAEIIHFGIVEDSELAITEAFEKADKLADAVISSGGVSVGDADYTKLVLDRIGKIQFWKIAMKPGKPFAFGTLPNSYFFGLPGNPVSALVTAHQLAVPALLKLQNTTYQKPITIRAKTTALLRKSPGRLDFQRGVLTNDDEGNLVVTSTGSQGSGILTSISSANCYIVLPAEQGRVEAGEMVDVQMFDKYLK